jgi:hypothetical protein
MPFERSRKVSLARPGLFFGNVNQVLVRLWARVTGGLSLDGSSVPLSGRLCLTGRVARKSGAPTVGRRGFRGVCERSGRKAHSAVAQAIAAGPFGRDCCVRSGYLQDFLCRLVRVAVVSDAGR